MGAQVKRIGGSLPTAPTLGLAPPGYEIPPLRGWQKPLQDPTPVERARTVTRMAGVLNHAQTAGCSVCDATFSPWVAAGIRTEVADIRCGAVGGHADDVVITVDIDGRGVGVDDGQRAGRLASLRGATFSNASGHDGSPLMRGQVESQYMPTRSERRPSKKADSPTGSGEPVTNDEVVSSRYHVVNAGTRALTFGGPRTAPTTIV